jgi:hypothetical protein
VLLKFIRKIENLIEVLEVVGICTLSEGKLF